MPILRLQRGGPKRRAPIPKVIKPKQVKRCQFLGEPTGESLRCRLCGERGKLLPVFDCRLFDELVTESMSGIPKARDCRRCRRFGGLAVTSLRPAADRRQADCLDSWRSNDLAIVAVQGVDDNLDQLKRLYPDVDQWIQIDETGKPRVCRIVEAIRSRWRVPFVLINADIELTSDYRFPDLDDERFRIGYRINEGPKGRQAERWGLDVFYLTPDQADRLIDSPFQIGEPWWDYWIAYHYQSMGLSIDFDRQTYRHLAHRQRWNRSRHHENKKAFCALYGLADFWASAWRRSLGD